MTDAVGLCITLCSKIKNHLVDTFKITIHFHTYTIVPMVMNIINTILSTYQNYQHHRRILLYVQEGTKILLFFMKSDCQPSIMVISG